MDRKKLILVDDHRVVRKGLKVLIERLGNYEVTEEFDNGLELVNAYPFSNAPDLILMDISMPKMNGDEALEKLNQQGSKIPVLVLTLTHDDDRIIRLFRGGVRGYLEKDSTAEVLKQALKEVFETGYYHNEFLTFSLRHDTQPKRPSEQEQILEQLTDREREFLKLVCHEEEYTYDQIAGHMGVQHRTVDGYRESIFDKFAIKSKTGLVLFVLRHRLMDIL